MPEKVDGLWKGHREGMPNAGIDDDFEIALACDRLTFRGWCPIVFIANHYEDWSRWIDAVVAEGIVCNDACDLGVVVCRILRVGRAKRRIRPEGKAHEEDVLRIDVGH